MSRNTVDDKKSNSSHVNRHLDGCGASAEKPISDMNLTYMPP